MGGGHTQSPSMLGLHGHRRKGRGWTRVVAVKCWRWVNAHDHHQRWGWGDYVDSWPRVGMGGIDVVAINTQCVVRIRT